MRKLLKRFAAAASAVVIGGVSCVTVWFSVPVSAAGGVGMLEWLEFQTLLQGIGVGGNNSDFADSVQDWIDGIGGPEMPREEYDGKWMTNYEYYNRLGWDSIIDWFDGLFSGDNSYSDIADVGTDVSGGSSFSVGSDGHSLSLDSIYSLSEKTLFPFGDYCFSYQPFVFSSNSWDTPASYQHALTSARKILVFLKDTIWICSVFADADDFSLVNYSNVNNGYFGIYQYINGSTGAGTSTRPLGNWSSKKYLYRATKLASKDSTYFPYYMQGFSHFGLDVSFSSETSLDSWFSSTYSSLTFSQKSDNFIGPVYTYPAAQDLYKSTGTAAGIRLDVQTQDGVPDIQAALDGAGVDTVDDLVAGVAAGTVPMSKVFADAKVTPYVVADTATGAVVTDLGVSATAAGVKAVGLTQDLAVPKDLTTAAAYTIKGKTWDPEMSKYKLPLFEYFPFCLPWDIYQVLAAFSADPVAPVFDVPVGKILSGVRSANVSKAASVSAKIDFGDDNWSKVFEVIRILECAGIIVGLCLVAVYLIHGGR